MNDLHEFDPVLAVMNPRNIPECVASLERLPIRRVWMQRYTEWELQSVMASVIADEQIAFTHLALVSDDVIVTPEALAAVLTLAREHDVATGYCRLDSGHPMVNLTKRPLMDDEPSPGAYEFYSYDEVQAAENHLPTGFVGFAVTCMSRDMWRRFPFTVYGNESSSYSSDFHLSRRLAQAGVPMYAARGGYVEHVKSVWNRSDDPAQYPNRRLLVGQEPARLVVEG